MKTGRTRPVTPLIAKPAQPEKAGKPIGLNPTGGAHPSNSPLARFKGVVMEAILNNSDSSFEITIEPCPPPCNALPFLGFSTLFKERATLIIMQADPTIINHLSKKGVKRISLDPNVKSEEITALFKLLETPSLDWQRFSQPNIRFNKY
ncbi:MAG: hypothetical protein WC500_00615 [Candidatus Margulisiibacteriota bacterium]